MMMNDPKKIATMIIASKKPSSYSSMKDDNSKMSQIPDSDAVSDLEKGSVSEGLKAASEEILSAIEAKDADALAVALKSAYSMCDDDEGYDEERE